MTELIETNALFLVPFCDKDVDGMCDLVDSITTCFPNEVTIIAVDDRRNKHDHTILSALVESGKVTIFNPEYDQNWPRNTFGSLFCKKYQAMEYAIRNYRFPFMICVDTDALATGQGLLHDLEEYFRTASPNIGMLGSYRIRADGTKRTRWQWALRIWYHRHLSGKGDRSGGLINSLFMAARQHGYRSGEHVLGGAFIVPFPFIKEMIFRYPYREISEAKLQYALLGDDVLFSLMVFACGYKIADFGRPEDPLVIGHKCLPVSKDSIINGNKKIIHSVKAGLDGETEGELREYFRRRREQ